MDDSPSLASWIWIPFVIGASALPVVWALTTAITSVQTEAIETNSLIHARRIVQACEKYSEDHGGNYPPSLDVLFPKYLKDRSALISPLQPHEPVGYLYVSGLTKTSPPDTVIVEDKHRPRHGHDRIVVDVDDSARILLVP